MNYSLKLTALVQLAGTVLALKTETAMRSKDVRY